MQALLTSEAHFFNLLSGWLVPAVAWPAVASIVKLPADKTSQKSQ